MKCTATRRLLQQIIAECQALHQWRRASHAASRIDRLPAATSVLCPRKRSLTRGSFQSLSTGSALDPGNIRSPVPDIEIPKINFAELMFQRCDEFKDLIALEDFLTGRKYTYKQLKDFSIRVASALRKQGYKKGDVIATFTINIPEFSILILAAAALGVAVSTANPAYTAAELSRQLSHCGATAVFTIPQLVPVVKEAVQDPDMPHLVKEVYTFGHKEEGVEFFNTLMEDDGRSFPENLDLDPMEDVWLMPYSSGTTGLPKGVMLTHHNIVANVLQLREILRLTAGVDKTLGLLPFFHIYGLTAVQYATLYDGGHLVTVPRFDPEMFLKSIQNKKISIVHAVPPIVLFLAKHPVVSKFDLSSIKFMISGAAPLGEALTIECQNRLGFPIYQGYGLTETSPVINLDGPPGHPGTIGTLMPNTVAKIVNVETGKPAKVGEMGEYCMKGPQNMLGYLHNQQATDEMIDKDGWLHTGDLGILREDGFVVIEDRLKELIKYKGFQVPPAELEGLLLTHPAVQDVGVIGIPEEGVGELPRAYIVLKPKATATAEDIVKFVEDNAAPSKKLRGGVEFIEQIPKTASGKILRRVLKAKVLQSS